MTEIIKKKRGFAVMSPEMQRKIASNGGKAAHAAGKAHRYTAEEARAAQLKGAATRKANNARRRAEKEAEK